MKNKITIFTVGADKYDLNEVAFQIWSDEPTLSTEQAKKIALNRCQEKFNNYLQHGRTTNPRSGL